MSATRFVRRANTDKNGDIPVQGQALFALICFDIEKYQRSLLSVQTCLICSFKVPNRHPPPFAIHPNPKQSPVP
jgi:hypothetical protein